MRFTADLRMYRHSGIGRYLRNVVPLLLPQLRADKIRIVAPRGILGEAAWLGDERLEFHETSAAIYSVQEQMLAVSGAYRATDLLWVPHFNVPLLYRGRLAVTMHDVAPLAMPEILGNGIKRAYAKRLIERAAHHATALLCVSEFTQGELVKRLGVPREKATVTPLGLDAEWPRAAVPHREADGAPYLLFVGNVKPNKNLSLLLRAFAEVQEKLPYRLVLAGRIAGFGTEDRAVLDRIAAMGDRVRCAGEVTDAELHSLYAGAAALVLPSLYEGFGFPLLEAMSLDCPVLASTAGSLPEVGGDAALYFDSHSVEELAALLCEVGDEAKMQQMRERGRERVAQFSFERCAHQSAAVFNAILEGHA